jgi:hypothetical protein
MFLSQKTIKMVQIKIRVTTKDYLKALFPTIKEILSKTCLIPVQCRRRNLDTCGLRLLWIGKRLKDNKAKKVVERSKLFIR